MLFAILSTEAIAHRIQFHRDTVTLESAKAIYAHLSVDAQADGHETLSSQTHEVAATIQELIHCQEPRGLVDSGRFIESIDAIVETARDLRDSTSEAYDRYDKRTAQAAEALEILLAYSDLLGTADFELRTGTRAA
ncbi:hypothetical protein [Arthrobacter sp. UYCo732]|uniref:hypothetical protein n=1 Tax=Arthrobacter sp. UYCo732 TaxID=3156336 RepID=UPI003399D795